MIYVSKSLICRQSYYLRKKNCNFGLLDRNNGFITLKYILFYVADVQANVVRDFGISTGVRNASVWTRRYLHITQDGIQTGLTLWNDQVIHLLLYDSISMCDTYL